MTETARVSGRRLTLTLLGGWGLRLDDDPVAAPQGSRRLVTLLALRGSASRPTIAGTLWPESDEPAAAASLRTALWRLGPARATVVDDGAQLGLDPAVAIDVDRMRRCAARLVAGEDAPDCELLELELLPGWYDDWLIVDRERQRQLRLHALEALSARRSSEGRHAEAVDAALAAVGIEPLRETAHLRLVEAYLAESNLMEAVRQAGEFRRLLSNELGVAPSRRFQMIVEAMLDPALTD